MALSLYVHIPFCLKRCIYCDFVSGIYSPEKESSYIEALKKEILNISNEHYPSPIPLPQARGRVSSLYIGGGTPTALSTKALTDLIAHIFNHLRFAPPHPPLSKGGREGGEATIEANPGTVSKEKLRAIRYSGINRISIGVQSFNDNELDFLGRLHSSKDAEQTVYLAKETGFENIGIDLIYGIPGQSIDSWRRTLEKAVSLKPRHISTYELTVEEGTLLYEYMAKNPPSFPFSKGGNSSPLLRGDYGVCCPLWQNPPLSPFFKGGYNISPPLVKGGEGGFAEENKIIEMYDYAIDYLTAEGFIHYEISNFAMPDYFCKHNLNYWDRGEYYGVGLGAHSFINPARKGLSNGVNGKRYHNTAILDDYINLISANKSPVKSSEEITEDKAASEAIFLGLRKTEGINLKAFQKSYGKDILTLYHEELRELQDAGLVEINPLLPPFNSPLTKGGYRGVERWREGFSDKTDIYLRLTRKGLLLSNEVFRKFM
ncbi:MAG: radical SAM protein [Nitrospirae bacterium]|nr:radical SAM protein [Nitrospirota bacterium]